MLLGNTRLFLSSRAYLFLRRGVGMGYEEGVCIESLFASGELTTQYPRDKEEE